MGAVTGGILGAGVAGGAGAVTGSIVGIAVTARRPRVRGDRGIR
jgi:hypothetical protein